MLENIIKTSSNNSTNIQSKGINITLNTSNEDIKKTKEKVKNSLNENKKNDNNKITAEINIGTDDANKNIRILNSFEQSFREKPDWDYIKNFKNEIEMMFLNYLEVILLIFIIGVKIEFYL